MGKRGRIPDQAMWFCKSNGTNFYRQLNIKLDELGFVVDKIKSTVSGCMNEYNLLVDGICSKQEIICNFRAYFKPTGTNNPKESIYQLDKLEIYD